MRLVIFQLAGDFRDAAQRIRNDEPEYYHAQRYSVESVFGVAKHCEAVTVVVGWTPEAYDEVLPGGIRAIGLGNGPFPTSERLIDIIAAQRPTHLVMRSPFPGVMKWAIATRLRMIAVFAESMPNHSLRRRYRNWMAARLLNHKAIEFVGTYGLTASRGYARIGVNADKLIPWDFLTSPDAGPDHSRELPADVQRDFQLFYVGKLQAERGLEDILSAMALLKSQGMRCHLTVVGASDDGALARRCEQIGLAGSITDAGLVPVAQLEGRMAASDAVLVPSRRDYPEGFPLVIHHALRASTPLIISDHPMFVHHLRDGDNALVFAEGDVAGLAAKIQRLATDPALYRRLSERSHATWREIRMPVKFGDLLSWWVQDSPATRALLSEHRLSGNLYR